jgi:hypothetical protein
MQHDREHDVIVVDCPGSLEGTETLGRGLVGRHVRPDPDDSRAGGRIADAAHGAVVRRPQGASPRGGEPGGPAQESGAGGVGVVAARRDGDPADDLIRPGGTWRTARASSTACRSPATAVTGPGRPRCPTCAACRASCCSSWGGCNGGTQEPGRADHGQAEPGHQGRRHRAGRDLAGRRRPRSKEASVSGDFELRRRPGELCRHRPASINA